MNLHRILAPNALPVSLAEVKAGAGLDGLDDEDARIVGLIRAATEQVDGPDGLIQRALITQTWELRLDHFPGLWVDRRQLYWRYEFYPRGLEIELPLPPLQAVVSISYVTGDVETVLDSTEYQVSGIGDRNKARIRPMTSWPGADNINEGVIVTFRAGYGDSWNDVPETIRLAIITKVKDLYDGCESGVPENLLRPYRVDAGFA